MSRIDDDSYLELIKQAQLDDRVSLERLAGLLEPRVCAYIYRLTLDHHLAEDLCQETLLELVKSFSFRKLQFKSAGMFSSWLFRTALGKVQMHFRAEGKRKVAMSAFDNDRLSRVMSNKHTDGLDAVVRKELAAAVFQAIGELRHSYRNVLALRCFEQMSYSEIASVMDCSELSARVSFFRAKRSLKQQLSRQGFSKTLFLTALGLFGWLTAPSKAAAVAPVVTAATVKVGLVGTLVGAAGTTLGIAVATGVVATVLATGSIAVLSNDTPPKRSDVRFIHFVKQQVASANSANSSRPNDPSESASEQIFKSAGAFEQWMHFPEGPEGPLIRRYQRWNFKMTEKLCSGLLDGSANYYYNSGSGTVYITNDCLWPLVLPTDSAEFSEFVYDQLGQKSNIKHSYDKDTGLLVRTIDNRVATAKNYKTRYDYSSLDESVFEYNWPKGTKVVDQRDKMHKRGWTYLRITGQINNEQISGYGQIPFVYNAMREHPPWLRLKIGDRLQITDLPSGARLANSNGELIAALPSGSFFRGLPQPWMGICTHDIVRRNAAKHRLRFRSRGLQKIDQQPGYKKAEVRVYHEGQGIKVRLIYLIDLQKDVVESVHITSSSDEGIERQGVIRFEYLEDVEQMADEFIRPSKPTPSEMSPRKNMMSFWLMELAQGVLGQPAGYTKLSN